MTWYPPRPAIERLRSNVSIADNGCWEWTGTKYRRGYGAMWYAGKLRRAHRVAYELYHGPISAGLIVHHTCRNTSCVNPDHLQAMPQGVHLFEHPGNTGQQNRGKTHCKHGHEFTPENTYRQAKGRGCLTCKRAWYKRNRAAAPRIG